jgi:hypothetical protein
MWLLVGRILVLVHFLLQEIATVLIEYVTSSTVLFLMQILFSVLSS